MWYWKTGEVSLNCFYFLNEIESMTFFRCLLIFWTFKCTALIHWHCQPLIAFLLNLKIPWWPEVSAVNTIYGDRRQEATKYFNWYYVELSSVCNTQPKFSEEIILLELELYMEYIWSSSMTFLLLSCSAGFAAVDKALALGCNSLSSSQGPH